MVKPLIIFLKDNTKALIDNLINYYYNLSFCTKLFKLATLKLEYEDLDLLKPLYQKAAKQNHTELKKAMENAVVPILNGRAFDWESVLPTKVSQNAPVRFHNERQVGSEIWQTTDDSARQSLEK